MCVREELSRGTIRSPGVTRPAATAGPSWVQEHMTTTDERYRGLKSFRRSSNVAWTIATPASTAFVAFTTASVCSVDRTTWYSSAGRFETMIGRMD